MLGANKRRHTTNKRVGRCGVTSLFLLVSLLPSRKPFVRKPLGLLFSLQSYLSVKLKPSVELKR